MGFLLFQVDAFTDRPFAGNPAAVCLMPDPKKDDWMQAVAAEMNLSETAFITGEEGGLRLRWFTPKIEVDLCGHATLAAAHILWSEVGSRPERTITFRTRSGALRARQQANMIELDFPSDPPIEAAPPAGLLDALDVSPNSVAKGRFDFLVEVESEDVLRRLAPDLARLRQIDARGVIVTARSVDSQYDFVSRFFAPGAGIDEDPVTGSAHCCLGPFWQDRLGKREFVGFQASTRGGIVHVRVSDDRVFLGGQAVTVMRGKICV